MAQSKKEATMADGIIPNTTSLSCWEDGAVQEKSCFAADIPDVPKATWNWIWQGAWRSKKGLLQVHQQQKEDQENVSLLLSGVESMVTKDMEKAEVFNAFFTMGFTVKTDLQQPLVHEVCAKVWSWKDLPFK